ncbi:MAG: hypothetical protein HON76_08970 [Candidatus Scalindua sp.]|jgi:polysaccharide chain length determinant protein (PEP-CTERM system associated)|nr:hypothetical protein [Candidatus Scalindua sp.]MBT6231546.1 hypothetical protein [Candidatus Scalindua sp.]MBT6562647.1 hypothetical protein [Candidatus Scalindua sp.]MBT7211132.1 hypothetical protein [Candidatus Scalindua sp.]
MEQENTQFDLQKYIKLLLRRKWLWIIPTILFSIGSTLYAIVQPDIYESKCVLLVERSKVMEEVIGRQGGLSAKLVIQLVRQKMLSWQSVVQMIKILELDKNIRKDDQAGLQKLYRGLTDKVKISARGRDLLQISYRGERPEINFRLVDGLVTNFIESSLKESRSDAEETVEFIEADLERLKKNLDESEENLLLFEEAQLENLPGSQDSKQMRLLNARKALVTIDREINALSERIGYLDERAEKEGKTVTGEITRVLNPKVKELDQQINKLEVANNTLRAKYFDEHPSIVKNLKVLQSLNEMREKESEKVVSEEKIINNPMYDDLLQKGFVSQLKIKDLQRQRKDTEEEIAILGESVKGMPAIRKELSRLQRDYSVNKQLYEFRLTQKAKAEVKKEMSIDAKTSPYRVVEPARISYTPIKSVKIKLVGMGVIMGFGLGVGLILGLEQIDQRFKTMEEIQNFLNVPALGMIPTILTNTEVERNFRKKIVISSAVAVFIIITAVVCLVVEPVKIIVSEKASTGWNKLVELAKQ